MRRRNLALLGILAVLGSITLLWWMQRPCVGNDCAPTLASAATPTRAAPTTTPSPTATRTPTATTTVDVVPYGAVLTEDGRYATPTPRPQWMSEAQLVEQFGDTPYLELADMPADLNYFVTRSLHDVTDFFEVPQEALVELLRARNGGVLRLVQRNEAGERVGAANLAPRLWNGWAFPVHDEYLESVRTIDQHGGYGFDWSARYNWQSWRTNDAPAFFQYGVVSDANPSSFEDNLAALARYLLHHGLTREAARRHPEQFEQALAAAIASFPQDASGTRPLAAPLSNPPDAEALLPIRAAFQQEMARRFGVRLSEEDQLAMVDTKLSAAETQQPVEQVAAQLVDNFVAQQRAAAQQAFEEGRPLPWPYLLSDAYLQVQEQAVGLLGHTLAPWEVELLIQASEEAPSRTTELLSATTEASLYAQSRALIDAGLQRSGRALPLHSFEITALLQPAIDDAQGQSRGRRGVRQEALILGTVEKRLRRTAEYRELNGDLFFTALPFQPMPEWVLQPFGVPASYQPDGVHTGLDLRGERNSAQQPTIHAIEAGTVVHVGPLYCLQEGACRGPYAVVIDHGNNIYSAYSHNSAALVEPGQQVDAGQPIARQGSEGYSRGPHLHLEVHVGARWSGNWAVPWSGGRFVDPWPWLPEVPEE